MKVKIIESEKKHEVKKRIKNCYSRGFDLVGPVQVTNKRSSHNYYVATMIKPDDSSSGDRNYRTGSQRR